MTFLLPQGIKGLNEDYFHLTVNSPGNTYTVLNSYNSNPYENADFEIFFILTMRLLTLLWTQIKNGNTVRKVFSTHLEV